VVDCQEGLGMSKALAVASIATFMVLGSPALVYADKGDDQGDHGGGDDDHRGAPEPLTIIGLALGAGGIVGARWAVNRRARRR
jgi:hypothetical protein